jgi:predicted PilT family ATPase
VLYIGDEDVLRKEDALRYFLEECGRVQEFPVVSVGICVPETKVPLLVGRQGATIDKMRSDTKADIDIAQAGGSRERTITVSAKSVNNILRACMRIY